MFISQNEISIKQTTKMAPSDVPDIAFMSQDGTPLSEMDKAAVLTLIREEVRSEKQWSLSVSNNESIL